MKRLALVLLLAGFGLSTQLSAQCSGSSSAEAKPSCCSKTTSASAAAAATPGSNIEQRVATDGSVSFVRKETSAQTGTTTYTQVAYNQQTGEYVAVTPAQMADEAAAQPKHGGEASAAGGCNQNKTAGQDACCAKPGTEASSSSTNGAGATPQAQEKTQQPQSGTRVRRSNTVKLASYRG
jgi:hypothetical protein